MVTVQIYIITFIKKINNKSSLKKNSLNSNILCELSVKKEKKVLTIS